jgi:hypothetical protein
MVASASSHTTGSEEQIFGDFNHRLHEIHLLSQGNMAEPVSEMSLMRLDDLPKEEKAKIIDLASTPSFAQWKQFEDELVSFYYPDTSEINLNVRNLKGRIRLHDSVGNTQNTFIRAYELKIGAFPYAIIMVDQREEFDDGICFCGAIAYEKYGFRNGSLYRYSTLGHGVVKKVQILRGGFRVEVAEWTHMFIHETAYLKIAESIRIKGDPLLEEAARKSIFEKYGFKGRLGFVNKGFTRNQVLALLGKPSEDAKAVIKYVETEVRFQSIAELLFEAGHFKGFSKNSFRIHQLPPEPGSADYLHEKIQAEYHREKGRSPIQVQYDLGKLTKKDVQDSFSYFLTHGATMSEKDWREWCFTLWCLNELGHQNKAILPILKERYLEPELYQHHTEWLLRHLDLAGSQPLFQKKLRGLMDQWGDLTQSRSKASRRPVPKLELLNIFSFLDKNDPVNIELFFNAMKHTSEKIRENAVRYSKGLPVERLLPQLLESLQDESEQVRLAGSRRLVDYADPSHEQVLQECLGREQDSKVREALEKCLQKASGVP